MADNQKKKDHPHQGCHVKPMRRTRTLSQDDLTNLLEAELDNLASLAVVYDQGQVRIITSMATVVKTILTENAAAMRERKLRIFKGPAATHSRRTLSAMHKLTIAKFGVKELTFEPYFYISKSPLEKEMKFKEWWNKDIVYQASAARPGIPPGVIPLDPRLQVPYERREKLTRLQLVGLIRNKFGAHLDRETPVILEEINNPIGWASFSVQTEGVVLSTDDGTLPVKIGPLPAMIRQIVHELLVAYGRSDPPPPTDSCSHLN